MFKRLSFVLLCAGAIFLTSAWTDSGALQAHGPRWGGYRVGPYYSGYRGVGFYRYGGPRISIGIGSYPSYYSYGGYSSYPYYSSGLYSSYPYYSSYRYPTRVYYSSPVIVPGGYGYSGSYGYCH